MHSVFCHPKCSKIKTSDRVWTYTFGKSTFGNKIVLDFLSILAVCGEFWNRDYNSFLTRFGWILKVDSKIDNKRSSITTEKTEQITPALCLRRFDYRFFGGKYTFFELFVDFRNIRAFHKNYDQYPNWGFCSDSSQCGQGWSRRLENRNFASENPEIFTFKTKAIKIQLKNDFLNVWVEIRTLTSLSCMVKSDFRIRPKCIQMTSAKIDIFKSRDPKRIKIDTKWILSPS